MAVETTSSFKSCKSVILNLLNLTLSTFFSPLWLNIMALILIGLMVSLALVPTYDKILDAAE